MALERASHAKPFCVVVKVFTALKFRNKMQLNRNLSLLVVTSGEKGREACQFEYSLSVKNLECFWKEEIVENKGPRTQLNRFQFERENKKIGIRH